MAYASKLSANGSTYDILDRNMLIETTYANLVNLRDNSQLIPGHSYRITDYVTTTSQSDTQSAGHAFDVIVTADAANKLNENARAIQHSGDTYFNDQKLESWQLKYCLDNDTNRFAWANTSNGKGVIYYMKDEYGNECGYDFKNIQFKRYKITATTATNMSDYVNQYWGFKEIGSNTMYPQNCTIDSNDTVWKYTFDYYSGKDYSLNIATSNKPKLCHGNSIDALFGNSSLFDNNTNSKKRWLNSITFQNAGNTAQCYGNKFESRCYSMSFGNECYSNSFGNECYSNSFGNYCYSNSFGINYCSNSFGSSGKCNSFGNSCKSNSFGINYYSNSFGNNCNSNSFGNECCYNSFGNYCNSNSFGNNCYSNSFGNDCYYNSFGNDCCYNSFGNYCYNSFGNYCNSNSFGNNCHSNSFGNSCNSNSFGNYCNSNSFGNDCNGITLVTAASSAIFPNDTIFCMPKFNFYDTDSDYGFLNGGSDTSDTSNPKIYVSGTAFNIGDFDITVQIPYEFVSYDTGSSLTGTYTLTVPANNSVEFKISVIVSSVEEAEGYWVFDAEFDYLLGSTNIHYTGHYEHY